MEKILIVDDSKNIRKLLKVILESENFRVKEAKSARQALNLLEKEKFKIAIVDIVMPVMDGIQLTEIIREKHPGTEVIIASTMKDKDNTFEAIEKGACYYVYKPFKKEELIGAVNKARQLQLMETESGQLDNLVALHRAAKIMVSNKSLDDVIEFILKVAANTVNADGGSLALVEQNSEKLVIKTAIGSRSDKATGKKFDPGQRVCGRAMKRKKSILVDDKVRSRDWFQKMEKFENIYSGMSIPMVIRNEVIGVINLKRTEIEEDFMEKDVMVMEILAADASITIENARLG
ncbi:MAG: response regulator [Elusimicrobiota bacterium]